MVRNKPTAKEELSNLSRWKPPLLSAAFYPRHTKAAVATLSDSGDGERGALATTDLIEVRNVVHNCWEHAGTFESLKGRLLRLSPYTMFTSWDRRRALGYDSDLSKSYLRFLGSISRPRLIVKTVREFLYVYPSEWESFELWLAGLRTLVATGNGNRLLIWQERNKTHRILYKNGPETTASFLYNSNSSTEGGLAEAGITPAMTTGGYAAAIYEEYLYLFSKEIAESPLTKAKLSKLTDFAFQNGDWRFPNLKHRIAEAMLSPFTEEDPDEQTKSLIQDFLLEHFGDPRVKRGEWYAVSNAAKRVLRRWLVGATLDDFFKLLDKTALDEHWSYRHAFWKAYFKRGTISDAWVVLGRQAQVLAKRMFDNEFSAFGKLSKGCSSNHSVLLMRIGSVTIAEWSHNGSCRLWLTKRRYVPELYRNAYEGDEFRVGADKRIVHTHSHVYSWQGRLSDIIYRKTGIEVRESEYKVRRH